MLEQVIREALAAAPPEKRDAALAELAAHYAGLIDNAAPAAKYRKAMRWLTYITADSDDPDGCLETITTALAVHTVTSDLGPKLLATMEALLMSPRARRTAAKEATPDDKPAPNPLDQLAERRAGKGRAAPVHAAATGSEQP